MARKPQNDKKAVNNSIDGNQGQAPGIKIIPPRRHMPRLEVEQEATSPSKPALPPVRLSLKRTNSIMQTQSPDGAISSPASQAPSKNEKESDNSLVPTEAFPIASSHTSIPAPESTSRESAAPVVPPVLTKDMLSPPIDLGGSITSNDEQLVIKNSPDSMFVMSLSLSGVLHQVRIDPEYTVRLPDTTGALPHHIQQNFMFGTKPVPLSEKKFLSTPPVTDAFFVWLNADGSKEEIRLHNEEGVQFSDALEAIRGCSRTKAIAGYRIYMPGVRLV